MSTWRGAPLGSRSRPPISGASTAAADCSPRTILLRDCPRGIDAFDPANLLILTSSVVAGHPYAGLARFTAAAKSPLTGGIGETRCEGPFGHALKGSGVDALIFHGAAERPTVIRIEAGRAHFDDAGDLWGQPVSQCVDALEARFRRRHPYGGHRPGRREPRPLRQHRQRPHLSGRPHGDGRGHGRQAPQSRGDLRRRAPAGGRSGNVRRHHRALPRAHDRELAHALAARAARLFGLGAPARAGRGALHTQLSRRDVRGHRRLRRRQLHEVLSRGRRLPRLSQQLHQALRRRR